MIDKKRTNFKGIKDKKKKRRLGLFSDVTCNARKRKKENYILTLKISKLPFPPQSQSSLPRLNGKSQALSFSHQHFCPSLACFLSPTIPPITHFSLTFLRDASNPGMPDFPPDFSVLSLALDSPRFFWISQECTYFFWRISTISVGGFRFQAILIRFCTFGYGFCGVFPPEMAFEMLLVALIWGFSSVPLEWRRPFFFCLSILLE